jgi:hypothetical protein
MTMTPRKISSILGLMLLAAGLTGCATTPESRVEQNAALVATWPAEVQVQVRAGKVLIGFSAEQVRVAVGEPDRIVQRTDGTGAHDVWVYVDRGPRFSFGVGGGSGGGGSGVGGGMSLGSRGRRERERMRLTFENGKVSAIEQAKS